MMQQLNDLSPTLFEPGWIEYNSRKWDLTPHIFEYSEGEGKAGCSAVFYLNKQRKIRTPKLNPYTPVRISYTNTKDISSIYRQTLEMSAILAQEIQRLGINNHIYLPPGYADIRPMQWNGLLASPAFTFLLQFPYLQEIVHSSVKKNIRKAKNAGFHIGIEKKDFNEIVKCINDTEARQKFSYAVSAEDLLLLQQLLGENKFRCYTATTDEGTIAAVRIILLSNHKALDLIAATASEFLDSGVTQLLIHSIFEEISNEGCVTFDFAGAGIKGVAQAKANWGATLTPYYGLFEKNLRWYAMQAYNSIVSR